MNYLVALYFVLLFLMGDTSLGQTQEVIALGEQKYFPSASPKIWIEKSQVLKAEGDGRGFFLKALKEGESQVQINHNYFTIQVLHPQKAFLYEKFQKQMQSSVGLSVAIKNGEVWVQGQIYRWLDWQKLQKIAKNYPADYKMGASVSESIRHDIIQKLNRILKNSHLEQQNFVYENNHKLYLAEKTNQLQQYKDTLGSFGIEVIKDAESIQLEPIVKVQITVAEVRRELSRKWGLEWPASANAKLVSPSTLEISPPEFNAHFLEQKGFGKILASPNIICKSGQEAEFLAGGEFPIKILNFKVQDVVWKKYGILLKVKPKADRTGRISLSIETEVSTIDNSRVVDGIPGLLTNKVSSHFDLRQSDTIVLSGLIKNEDGRSHQGLPGLSSLPILGALFSSQDFKENRTELVILVQPQILQNSDKNSQSQHLISGIE